MEGKMNLTLAHTQQLQHTKNLLGFSGGADSVALFFMLVEQKIAFDIVIIDYGIRAQSKEEVAFAKSLASKYNKLCFAHKAPKFSRNFEANARAFRYKVFEDIIQKHSYKNLILAHHLNDRVEWFFMQFAKGAGVATLLGFDGVQKREGYDIVRPMLWISKDEILSFLKVQNLRFYEDETNADETYKRNFIRHRFTNEFVRDFSTGIQKSLSILQSEKALLYHSKIQDFKDFIAIEFRNNAQAMYAIDIEIKKQGYILSASQRLEIERTDFSCKIGSAKDGFTIQKLNPKLDSHFVDSSLLKDGKNSPIHYTTKIIVSKNLDSPKLPKEFKEFARIHRIPVKLRAVLYHHISQSANPYLYETLLESLYVPFA